MDYIGFAADALSTVSLSGIGEIMKSVVLPLTGLYVAHKFGGIQAAIARQQASTAAMAAMTARTKLNLDLFDKRWQVYKAARELIGVVGTKNSVSQLETGMFAAGIQGSQFLFDDSVHKYLGETLWGKALELQKLSGLIEPAATDFDALTAEKTKLLNWFYLQHEELDRRLGPYLRIEARLSGASTPVP